MTNELLKTTGISRRHNLLRFLSCGAVSCCVLVFGTAALQLICDALPWGPLHNNAFVVSGAIPLLVSATIAALVLFVSVYVYLKTGKLLRRTQS